MKSKDQGKWTVTLWGLLVALLAVGCGSQSKKSTPTPPASSGDVTRALNCGGEQEVEGEELTLADTGDGSRRRVPAEDLVVQQGEATISLCNMMRANPDSELGLFFFTSAGCFKCTTWIQKVAAGLEPYGNKVLPVAIVSNSLSALSDAEIDEIKEDAAPDFVWVRDPAGEVWNFFAPDQGAIQKIVPMVIEMDRGARGFSLEDTGLEAKDLIDQATEILGLDLGDGA